MSPLTLPQRIYLGAIAILALWVGVWCLFVPSMSDMAIPWRVSPLCAVFLGATYLSGAVYTASCMAARRWFDVRTIMPQIAIWTGGLTIVSLFHWSKFDFSRGQVWIWFGAYIVYPLIALGLMWTHRSQRGLHPVGERPLAQWARHYLVAQGALMTVLAVSLLLASPQVQALWPWQTGRLMLQIYSMPILSYGIGSFILARQSTWSEIRLGLVSIGVFSGAALAGSAWQRALLNGPALSVAAWLAWLGLTTLALGWLAWRAYRPEGKPMVGLGATFWRLRPKPEQA